MAIEVKMPELGESVFEGTVGKWLKAEGDRIEEHEPILEVITDKVDTEITATGSGTLLKIIVPEGETVRVGTVLALVGEPGEDVTSVETTQPVVADAMAGTAPTAPAATAAAEPAPASPIAPAPGAPRVSPVAARVAAEHGVDVTEVAGTGPGGAVTREDVERHADGSPSMPRETAASPPQPEPTTGKPTLGFISPRVARLAAENGVDLRQVAGTGLDGRITARDVERFIDERSTAPRPTANAPSATEDATTGAGTEAAASPTLGRIVELTPMRQAIAEHMVRSKHTAPHVTTVHEADMSAVIAARDSLKDQFLARGVRLTFTAFIIQAVADALVEHPMVNSSWTDDGIRVRESINIGVAVALETGLIVPVVHNADQKSLMGLAREVVDLADRARDKKLVPDDVQGGTFTISNYGTLGSLFGTPIISQPQTAILGTGAIRKQVVVLDGPGGDTMAIRPMMFLALTFDHRVLDGGMADPFVQTIVRKLESYEV